MVKGVVKGVRKAKWTQGEGHWADVAAILVPNGWLVQFDADVAAISEKWREFTKLYHKCFSRMKGEKGTKTASETVDLSPQEIEFLRKAWRELDAMLECFTQVPAGILSTHVKRLLTGDIEAGHYFGTSGLVPVALGDLLLQNGYFHHLSRVGAARLDFNFVLNKLVLSWEGDATLHLSNDLRAWISQSEGNFFNAVSEIYSFRTGFIHFQNGLAKNMRARLGAKRLKAKGKK